MLAISILVLLHEAGHFFFARLFGVKVEKFFLFFDPWFHLFQWKPKNSDTTYGVGWLPLGGYCKISGMIDESFDTEQMSKPAQPWEFRSKPAWQRLLIMLGGVLVNFFLALFIYSMILFYWGESYVPMKNMTYGMKFNQEAKQLGFQDGDILLGTDTKTFRSFNSGHDMGDVYRALSEAKQARVLRGGKNVTIAMPGNLNMLSMIKSDPAFVMPFEPATVDSVMAGTPAAAIGMKSGDKILAIGGKAVDSRNEFMDVIGRMSDVLAGAQSPKDSLRVRTTSVVFLHKGAARPDTAAVTLNHDLQLGIYFHNVFEDYKEEKINYSFFESFPAGVSYGISVLKGYVDDMKYVFTADGAKSLGGFGAIGSLFPGTWDWHMFWNMTAFLSIILAFMNILPIPALDGGHVLFLLYEIITRRKPSDSFMVKAEYVGFGILILLMLVANLNDVLRWIGVM